MIKIGRLKSSDIISSNRFDSSYHLSESVTYEKRIKSREFLPLSELVTDIFTAGRSKRIYVPNPSKGYPYLSNSNVVSQNPIANCKRVSKLYSYDKNSFLKEDMIVTGRVGAIGQTAFITSEFETKEAMGSDNIIRIVPKKTTLAGYLYTYLVSKYGNTYFWKIASGGVQPYISEPNLYDFPVPIISSDLQYNIHGNIKKASKLRVEANQLLENVESEIKKHAKLNDLSLDEYEYFGNHSSGRKVGIFKKNINEISSITINAFNHSKRVEKIIKRIKDNNEFYCLEDCLDNRKMFSTGAFPRIELNTSKGIKLINQQDIFNNKIEGKKISKRNVNVDNLVSYGELLIAGVGTLGENETFCRMIFANEELEGELVSGEFIRMQTNNKIPSGYLFAWLNSDYGFRLIRNTQTGTKLCRPIQKLLSQIPVPIFEKSFMDNVDTIVRTAHTLRYEALLLENQAITIIENELDSWQN